MLRTLALLAVVTYASACSRRRRWGGGGVTIGSPNIPAPPPPTPQPTPPPPPPPLPAGWQTPAFKNNQPPIQKQTRTNCKRSVKLVNEGSSDNVEIAEIWVYKCTFNVYIQTEVAATDSPQHCGCTLAYAREADPAADEQYETAYKTEITEVNIVSFDPQRAVVNEIFPQFANMRANMNSTQALADSAATATMDYSTAIASFTDLIEPVLEEDFPASLDKSNPENTNNIAAFCFKVEEEYHSTARWALPIVPDLSQQPNSWQTNCIPWDFEFLDETTAKRQDSSAFVTKMWWREFMTFPTGDTFAATSGFNPLARIIRTFYKTSDCQVATSVASFDREFRYRLAHENVYDMHGAFAFYRQFTSIAVVGGTPKSFQGAGMAFTGYTQVVWQEPYSRTNGVGAFRPGVLANALIGTPASGSNLDMPFIGATKDTKLCQQVPTSWFECTDPNTCDAVATTNAYNENAFFFTLPLLANEVVLSDPSLDCAPAYQACAEETTFLSAVNTGLYGRDFSIRPESLLAVGPRSDICADYPTIPALDSITFEAIQSGVELTKRGAGQLHTKSAASELPSHIKYMKRQGAVDRRLIVLPGSAQSEPALGKPEVRDVTVQAGGGSTDVDGLPAGDHPVRLFSETYAVPVSMDPADLQNDITHGRRVTGKAAPCIEGTQGCTCRTRRGRPRCDAPLTCTSGDQFPADTNVEAPVGYCQLPACLQGEAGCECTADDGCLGDNLECESKTCVFVQQCTPGSNGCKCDSAGACSDGVCTNDNVCVAHDCPPGMPGCACDSFEGNNFCFAEQGYAVPLKLQAIAEHSAQGNDLGFKKGDTIIVKSRADIDPQGDGIWQGVLEGRDGAVKEFPASKVAVAPGAVFEVVNAYECVADSVCKNSEKAQGELGGACLEGDSCNAGFMCDSATQVCKRERCTAGDSGCICKTDGSCTSGSDQCDALGICVTPTCSAGEGGCECSLGRCEAGFECDLTLGGDEGRCVKERCVPGTRGCPCAVNKDGDLSCTDSKFECMSQKTDGSDKRCVAVGRDCSSQIERCKEFCGGAGKVKDCPPCSNQIPLCDGEGAYAGEFSSASSLAVAMLALVFAVMAMF